MSVTALHTLYAVDVDPITEANAVFVDQVNTFSIDPALQSILQSGDGQVDPTFVAVMAQSPRLRFTSTALATILAEVSSAFLTSGIKIDSDGTHDGLEAFFHQITEGGTRTAGANHIKMTINEGLLIPRPLNAAQGGVASLDLEAVIGYDGTNEPVVIATGQSLIGTPAVGEIFTLGPVSLNGTTINGVQSIAYDPGLQIITQSGDGQVWPTFVAIMSRRPRLVINTVDVGVFSTFGLDGTAQSATDSVAYLRKIAEGGTRVADGTAEHIKLTFDDGIIYCGPISGSQGQVLGAQLVLEPTYDGTNAIVVIDAASAIT